VGPVPRSDYEVIILNEFQPGAPEAALVQGENINMQSLLSSCLQHEDTKLHMLPPVLLVRMPQFVHGGEDTENQWVQEETEGAPQASWGDGFFNFAACCDDGCPNASDAVYRIKGFVQYCRKPPVPSQAVSSGHYAAFFQEGGVWYRCDDLRDGGRPCALQGAPGEFPYICFFERVGQSRSPPPDLPANPVAARFPPQAEAEVISSDDDDGQEDEDEDKDEADRGKEGEPSSQRRNKLGKRDRKGRKQDRSGRGKRTEDRKDRKQDREGRDQDRKGQKQERSGRCKQTENSIKRARTQGPRNDNADASRKDLQADADSPVKHHVENARVQQQAALCRKRFGHLFVLLHVLGNTIDAGTPRQPYLFMPFVAYASPAPPGGERQRNRGCEG